MIIGAHSIVYSKNHEADRAFFKDVLKCPSVDVGGGWLIFGLPPAEVAVHPSDENDVHELYLMTDDLEGFIADMTARGIACTPVTMQGWGALTSVMLPGGGKLGVYQPRHKSPKPMAVKAKKKAAPAKKKPAATAKKQPAAKKAKRR